MAQPASVYQKVNFTKAFYKQTKNLSLQFGLYMVNLLIVNC